MRRPTSCDAVPEYGLQTGNRAARRVRRLTVIELSKVEAQEVLGLDLGDRSSQICRMDRKTGAVLEERRLSTTTASVQRYFSSLPPQLVALESGTHSLWMTRLVTS